MARSTYETIKTQEEGEISRNRPCYSTCWAIRFSISFYQLVSKHDGLETDGYQRLQS